MLGALVVAGLSIAAPPCVGETIRVDWVRTAAAQVCPDGAEVAAGIRAQLGCDPFGKAPTLRFEVSVDARDEGWMASVLRYGATGVPMGGTELSTGKDGCGVLADAVALAVSVVAEQQTTMPIEDSSPGVSTSTVPGAARTETATITRRIILVPQTTIVVPPRPVPVPWLNISGGTAMNVGTMPGPTAGVAVQLRLHAHRYLEIGADMLVLPTRRWSSYGYGLVAWAVAGCARAPEARWTFGGCARAYVGSLTTVVFPGADPLDPGPYLWSGLSGSVFGRWSLTPHVFFSGEAEAVAALPRRLYIATSQVPDVPSVELHSEAPVALFLRLGVGVRFGE